MLIVHARFRSRCCYIEGLLLGRFPIESRGRRKKLREVGCVTAICAACFTLRAVIVAWSAIDSEDADLVCYALLVLQPFHSICEDVGHEPQGLQHCLRHAQPLLPGAIMAIQSRLLDNEAPGLRRVPMEESSGQTQGCVTVQDVLSHPFLNLIYYTACELIPSALVLYILRKLPPRRSQQGYQQIPVR